jgi:ankyrin repeat protein
MRIEDIFQDYATLPEYSGIELLDVNQSSLFGDRPINVAATRGSLEEMEILLAHGAHVNDAGEHGYSPLHNAVEQGRRDAVEWLVKHGADVLARNDAGETPEDLATLLGEGEIASLLKRCMPGR